MSRKIELVILLVILTIIMILVSHYGEPMMYLIGFICYVAGVMLIIYASFKLWTVFIPQFRNMSESLMEPFKKILPSAFFDSRSDAVIEKEACFALFIGFINLTLGIILIPM